jgi:hypothetical protein
MLEHHFLEEGVKHCRLFCVDSQQLDSNLQATTPAASASMENSKVLTACWPQAKPNCDDSLHIHRMF